MRRIGIVALARKLLIALWRTLEDGVMIEFRAADNMLVLIVVSASPGGCDEA